MSARVAVIGTGWAERVQIPAFRAGGLEVVGLAGRDLDKTKRIAQELEVPFATHTWREILDLDCDLVSIVTPPALHKEQATAVLRAGKHLLCEKPVALNAEEAAEMLEVSTQHPNQLALVDHELRFVPARRKAKELLSAGAIGRLLTVTARVSSDLRTDPSAPWTWWSDAEQGGGILGAVGSHMLDGIRWLLGDMGNTEIRIRGATLGRVYPTRRDAEGHEREVTADDIASFTFSVGSGGNEAVGTGLVHGAALDEATDLLTLRGTEGTLVLDRSLKLYIGKGKGPLKEFVTHLPGIVPNRFRSSPYAAGTVLLAQALADALETGDHVPLRHAATLSDAFEVQRLIDEVRRLARE